MQSSALLLLALQLQSQPAETLLHQAAEALHSATLEQAIRAELRRLGANILP